jgi:thiamine-monophosphate kinase
MTMGELGEKGYIRRLFQRYLPNKWFTAQPSDAAVIGLDADTTAIALKIDRGPSAISFKLGLSGRIVDGRLAATACCSDLLAALSRPKALMISVTVPPETETADLDAALDGFMEVCEENSVEFVGGDTKAGAWNLVACGVGTIETPTVSRHGGLPGDLVVVCGEVGSFTAAALRAMKMTEAISLADATEILCHPAAAWAEAEWLRRHLVPSSGTDSSDGLYEALLNVAGRGCGVKIDEARLPFSDFARRVSADSAVPLSNFLYGGGDWNLVFTIPKSAAESLGNVAHQDHLTLAVVGEVTSEPGLVMSSGSAGYRRLRGIVSDHFLGRIEDPVKYFERLCSYSGWEDGSKLA